MPRQLYPGEFKFRILRDKAKQIKRRADNRRHMASLRERQLKEIQHNNDAMAQQLTDQAINRYDF